MRQGSVRLIALFAVLCSASWAQSDREAAGKLMASGAASAFTKTTEALHKASADFEQAAVLWRKLGDTSKQIEALYSAAWAHYPLHELSAMSALLTSAMDVASTAGSPAARAELLSSFAVLHNEQGEHRKAIDEYTQAREIHQSLKNQTAVQQLTAFQASSWRMQGNALEKTGDLPAAIEAHRQAAGLFQEANDAKRAGQQFLHLGQVGERIGTPAALEQAAAFFTSAIPLLETASDRPGLATAWWGLGSVTDSMGQTERSRDALLKVLPLLPDLQDPKAQGIVLKSLAMALEKLGDRSKAVEYYERALPLFAAAHDTQDQFIAGMRLGKTREALGQKTEALAAYQRVVAVTHAAGDGPGEAAAQTSIGSLQFDLRNWQAARDAYKAAQELRAKLGDKQSEAGLWGVIGAVYESQGQYTEKLSANLRGLELLEGLGNRQAETQALIGVGDAYNALHQSQQAIKYLEKARTLAGNDSTQKAMVLVELGEVYYGQTKLDQALDLENQALEIALKLNNPAFVTKIRNDLGLTHQARGEMTKAREIFEQGLAEARKRNDIQQVHSALHNLAKLRQDFGDNQESLKLYEEALSLSQRDGDRQQAAITLDGLAMAYHLLGQDDKSLATLNRALSEWRALGDENGESTALNNLAVVYGDMGRPQQALDAMNQALSKKRRLGDDAGVAELFRGLGGIYQSLGDYDRAESYFNQALDTQKRFGDEHGQALTHNSLGVIKMSQSEPDPPAALPKFNQALSLLQKFGDRRGEATMRSNMAQAMLEMGELRDAAAQFDQSLAISRQSQNVSGEALALHGLGSVYERSGELGRALESYRNALALWRDLRNVSAESKAHSLIAKVERKQGKLEAAMADIDESIRLLESQRGGLASEDIRAYYLASIAGPYKTKVDLLMDVHRAHPGQGFDARAFEASEQARARSLLDLLAESRVNVQKGADPELIARDRAAQRSIGLKAEQSRKLPSESADRKRLQLEIAELTAERERISAAIRAASPSYAALTKPQPLTLREIQKQVLDQQTLLLEYSLGEERSYLFAVTDSTLSVHELPKRAELLSVARDVYVPLQSFETNRSSLRQSAAALSTMLLSPVAGQLRQNRLIIVADGELAMVPFGALPGPSSAQPLILTNEIVIEPSASTVAVLRKDAAHRTKAAKELAVIADPVFEPVDARLIALSSASGAVVLATTPEVLNVAVKNATRGGQGLKRLDHSEAEARAILALAPGNRSLALLGFQANKPDVVDGRLAGYRIVHFATHGLIDQTHPQLSGLALSLYNEKGQALDGFLDLNAIFDLKLKADLVVLSACESGQGKLVGGEGLMGLTRGFFYAGAAGLVVSLWSVDDVATSELMKRFYSGMLGSARLHPAAALRAAQRSMILNSNWPDPYFWAAFTLEGEWR